MATRTPRKTTKGGGKPARRIAITTGGGDAPGLNAVIRAVVLSAIHRGWSVIGLRDGYDGLLAPKGYPHGGWFNLDRDAVRGILPLGGTILGTTNRGNPFRYPVKKKSGEVVEKDLSKGLLRSLEELGVDSLIAIGGDGSLGIAARLAESGLSVVGVPKTIDNDLDKTVITFGFDTAVSFATDALDRLHTTAEAHRRVMVVEVMGRYAGWIAMNSGVSAGADVILIPEIPYDMEKVAAKIMKREHSGRRFSIVVVAEGAMPAGGHRVAAQGVVGGVERLGGIGETVAREIGELTGKEVRTVVLGHLQRGGRPTSWDRLLALRFGAAAVRALDEGKSGVMVALDPPTVKYVPLELATKRMKVVPLDCDTILTTRDLGICLGD
jgi:6-phosphofructokinase 1